MRHVRVTLESAYATMWSYVEREVQAMVEGE